MDDVIDYLRRFVDENGPGSKLPGTKALMAQFTLGPATVRRAVAVLERAQLVESRPGSGTFVISTSPSSTGDFSWQTNVLGPARTGPEPVGSTMRAHGQDIIAMHSGYPHPELLPVELLQQATRLATRTSLLTTRPPAAGLPELRSWFAAEAAPSGTYSTDDVLITTGGQSALATTFRALANPGDAIIMESPTYWGAITAARQAGLVVVPISRVHGAPEASALDDLFRHTGAKLLYAQPLFANPTGDSWPKAARSQVLAVVRDHRAFLVEDDWARDFAAGAQELARIPRPLLTEETNGHVIYIRSLTKSLSPSLRLAAVIAQGAARQRIGDALTLDNLYVSGLLQGTAHEVVTRPAWQTHRRRLSAKLAERRDQLAAAVRKHAADLELQHLPEGGLNLWLRLPAGIEPASLSAQTLLHGLAISPGQEWYPAEPPAPFIRVNYAAPMQSQLVAGAAILGRSLAELREHPQR